MSPFSQLRMQSRRRVYSPELKSATERTHWDVTALRPRTQKQKYPGRQQAKRHFQRPCGRIDNDFGATYTQWE